MVVVLPLIESFSLIRLVGDLSEHFIYLVPVFNIKSAIAKHKESEQ